MNWYNAFQFTRWQHLTLSLQAQNLPFHQILPNLILLLLLAYLRDHGTGPDLSCFSICFQFVFFYNFSVWPFFTFTLYTWVGRANANVEHSLRIKVSNPSRPRNYHIIPLPVTHGTIVASGKQVRATNGEDQHESDLGLVGSGTDVGGCSLVVSPPGPAACICRSTALTDSVRQA